MPNRSRLAIASTVVLWGVVTSSTFGDRTSTWEFRNGTWQQVEAPPSAPVDAPDLDQADRLLAAGKHAEARKVLLRWERVNRSSPARDRAIYLLAEAYYQYGDRVRAFYHLDELLDTYPESPLLQRALEKQYQIADEFLSGYKLRFLGIPMLSAQEKGIEMLFRIQERSPGAALAEKSLLRTADHYYATGDYDLAGDAYKAYLRQYTRSPVLSQVRLRAAFCDLAQFESVLHDATPLIDARAELLSLANDDPAYAADQGVQAIIDRIDATLARKIYASADFYRRTRQPKAAVYNYRFLIDVYPASPEAAKAGRDLAHMPAWALADAPPPKATGYTPPLPQSDPMLP